MRQFTIFCFMVFLTSVSFAQNSNAPADKFMSFLNNYQVDSLQVLLADDFKLTRTFTSFSQDRAAFFDFYIPYSKDYNGEFIILERTAGKRSTTFLVEDKSDYFFYLGIAYPTWKISVFADGNRVSSALIDTTAGYKMRSDESIAKEAVFHDWLKKNYPEESPNDYKIGDGMFVKRAKEYYEKEINKK